MTIAVILDHGDPVGAPRFVAFVESGAVAEEIVNLLPDHIYIMPGEHGDHGDHGDHADDPDDDLDCPAHVFTRDEIFCAEDGRLPFLWFARRAVRRRDGALIDFSIGPEPALRWTAGDDVIALISSRATSMFEGRVGGVSDGDADFDNTLSIKVAAPTEADARSLLDFAAETLAPVIEDGDVHGWAARLERSGDSWAFVDSYKICPNVGVHPASWHTELPTPWD